jgi:hypothetical protein
MTAARLLLMKFRRRISASVSHVPGLKHWMTAVLVTLQAMEVQFPMYVIVWQLIPHCAQNFREAWIGRVRLWKPMALISV